MIWEIINLQEYDNVAEYYNVQEYDNVAEYYNVQEYDNVEEYDNVDAEKYLLISINLHINRWEILLYQLEIVRRSIVTLIRNFWKRYLHQILNKLKIIQADILHQ